MNRPPLVSIITPTWQRPEELARCIKNVDAQTYPNIEHIIVSDGPDMKTEQVVHGYDPGSDTWGRWRELVRPPRYYECGWNTTGMFTDSFGIGPLMLGTLVARGSYQTRLCDDEVMGDDHIEKLVALLEKSGVDFVYPRVYLWPADRPNGGWIIGTKPPKFGHITSVLYRRELLDKGMHRFHMPAITAARPIPDDWDMVSRWLEAGATYEMLDEVTLSHRADH